METKIFAIWDDAAKAYMQPFVRPTTGLAIRDFTNLVNDPQSVVSRHTASFTLFQLGTWDDSNGAFKNDNTVVLSALQVKETPIPGAQKEMKL